MRPTDYPIQHDSILEQWKSFTYSGKVDSVLKSDFLDPLILQSWQRCYTTHDPRQPWPVSRVRSSQIHVLLQSHNAWITSAIPHVEEVLQCLDGAGHAMLLTDRLGCALFLAGHTAITDAIQVTQLGIGSYWSEESMGTNAVGLALNTVMPIQVVGPEHFCQQYHQWTTAAAPIHNDEGRLIGAVALISLAENATRRDRALVMSTASAISGLLQTERYVDQANQQLLQMNAILEELDRGVLMWDAYNRVIYCNSAASHILGTSVTNLRGKDIEQIVRWPIEIQNALDSGANFDGAAIEFRALNQRIQCSLSIRVMNTNGARNNAAENFFVLLLWPQAREQVKRLFEDDSGDMAVGITMESAERLAIVQAGIKHHGAVTKMAAELSISRTTLWRKMRAFNMEPGQFKEACS